MTLLKFDKVHSRMKTIPEVRQIRLWQGKHHKIAFEIKQYGFDTGDTDREGWCYYIFLHESLLKDRFKEVWLEDRLAKWSDNGPDHVTHDYYSLDIFEFHGGITFYRKHGQVEGHRCVELGCDYQHFFDKERGYTDLAMVLDECANSCELAAKHFGLIPL